MASRIATKRLAKELHDLKTNGCPEGSAILEAEDLQTWTFTVAPGEETVYKGESFVVQIRFDDAYPMEAPEVVFLVDAAKGWAAPKHPHVYSVGHICLSTLGSDWSPVLNTRSLLLSLISMLASCKEKSTPPDDERYSRYAPKSPKQTRWVYHDDKV